MTLVKVKAHTRGVEDPFASIIEAKKPRFAAKWGVELVGTDDERLRQPIAPPLLDGRQMTMSEITRQLKALARFAKRIGRAS